MQYARQQIDLAVRDDWLERAGVEIIAVEGRICIDQRREIVQVVGRDVLGGREEDRGGISGSDGLRPAGRDESRRYESSGSRRGGFELL